MSVLPGVETAGNVGITPKMSDDAFRQLRAYIYEFTGIYFQDNKKYLLEGRIGKRLQLLGMADFEGYLQLLRYGSEGKNERRHLFDAVTINETFFFRNEPQFDAFAGTLVPEVIRGGRQNGHSKLRVWSAASSSGEEAYTLAMIFLERIRPKYPWIELEITGTDINSAVIENARKGVYRSYSIRNMPAMYLNKYFIAEESRYRLKDEVKQLVRFEQRNLYDRLHMQSMTGFDVIFCCNVLIYFDAQSKVQVVSSLYDGLNRGGYLFIGYAESLHGISTAFKLVSFPKAVAYKKE